MRRSSRIQSIRISWSGIEARQLPAIDRSDPQHRELFQVGSNQERSFGNQTTRTRIASIMPGWPFSMSTPISRPASEGESVPVRYPSITGVSSAARPGSGRLVVSSARWDCDLHYQSVAGSKSGLHCQPMVGDSKTPWSTRISWNRIKHRSTYQPEKIASIASHAEARPSSARTCSPT
jgi:hypothetical protein